MNRRKLMLLVALVVGILAGFYVIRSGHGQKPTATQTHVASAKPIQSKPTDSQAASGFDASAHSLTNPTSIWVVVNKQRPLRPRTYAPELIVPALIKRSNISFDERQIRPDTGKALDAMAAAAKTDGLTLTLESGYRSYNFQVSLYNRYVSEQGQTVADTQSARPGYSEHQTGLAADLGGTTKPTCNVAQCFADTPEGKWIAANDYKYGFIIRYQQGKDAITGYEYEPWHVRYVGTSLSEEMHSQGISTLEEFFKLSAAPSY